MVTPSLVKQWFVRSTAHISNSGVGSVYREESRRVRAHFRTAENTSYSFPTIPHSEYDSGLVIAGLPGMVFSNTRKPFPQ